MLSIHLCPAHTKGSVKSSLGGHSVHFSYGTVSPNLQALETEPLGLSDSQMAPGAQEIACGVFCLGHHSP